MDFSLFEEPIKRKDSSPDCLIVIPARLNSTRLPRKLLLRETGKSVLQHTYEQARNSRLADRIVVAADHEEIAAEVRGFGGEVMLTDPAAESGTDRVAEVAEQINASIVVNVQGDEPELPPESIDLSIALLRENPSAHMSTIATPIRTLQQLHDPACVKVVRDQSGGAMFFSRSPIPYSRDDASDAWLQTDPPACLHHLGLYAYRRPFLLTLASLPLSPAERLEGLEQLRALQAGFRIQLGLVQRASKGIDTAADYERFVERHRLRLAG